MQKFSKHFNKKLAITLCAMVLVCAMALSVGLLLSEETSRAARSTGTTKWTVVGDGNDIWLGNGLFDGSLLSELYMALTGTDTIEGVEAKLSNKALTSADFRTQQGGTKNVSVWFGGIKWDAVYLTKDKSGNVILDLWQSADGANSINDGQSAPSGTSYLPTCKYPYWTSSSNTTDTYPANMYSTSMLRVVGVNVGGKYSTSASNLSATQTQQTSSLYAAFTMANPGSGKESLTKYIVQPTNVAYQQTENAVGNSSFAYTCPNDAYGTPAGANWNATNYTGKGGSGETAYDNWQYDYLWIPSMAEVGNMEVTNQNGIWKTNEDLRSTTDASAWLRSGGLSNATHAFHLNSSGTYDSTLNNNSTARYVRPALHLNLTAAENDAVHSLAVPEDVSTVYNGEKQDLNTISAKPYWFNESVFNNSSKIKVEYVNNNMVNVGEYTVNVTIVDTVHYYWADNNTSSPMRTFKFKITQLQLPTPQSATVEYNGQDRTDYFESNATWYQPQYVQLIKSSNEFINAGEYSVTVKLTDTNVKFASLSDSVRECTIKLTIDKKVIGVQDFSVDDYGNLIGDTLAPDTIYTRDIGQNTAPIFALEYRKDSETNWVQEQPNPNITGKYWVRAYITNPETSNYVLSSDGTGEKSFIIPQKSIAVPHLVFASGETDSDYINGSTTTVPYTGLTQIFKLVNNGNDLEGIGAEYKLSGSIRPDVGGIFSAKDVGVYTIEVSLSDTDNLIWADADINPTATRIVTLIITPAELSVEISNIDEIENGFDVGTVNEIILEISGVVNEDKVLLKIYYTEGGGEAVDVTNRSQQDGVITVKIDSKDFKANTRYVLCVELDKDDKNVYKNYTLVNMIEPLEFFVLQATITELNPQWQYSNVYTGNVNIEAEDIETTDGAFSVVFNGYEYILVVDENTLPKGIVVEYLNQANKGTNANSYTTIVRFATEENSGYVIASDVKTVYTIKWTITPQEYDLSVLVWADVAGNLVYNAQSQVMSILNLPSWIGIGIIDASYTNSATVVGNYTAGYKLTGNQNYKFVNSQGLEWIHIDSDTSATITHDWTIEKFKIIVNGWSYGGGMDAPTCNVSDLPEGVSFADVLRYVVYLNGEVYGGALQYNTSYTIKLELIDTDNYEIEGVTEYEFTTPEDSGEDPGPEEPEDPEGPDNPNNPDDPENPENPEDPNGSNGVDDKTAEDIKYYLIVLIVEAIALLLFIILLTVVVIVVVRRRRRNDDKCFEQLLDEISDTNQEQQSPKK